MPASPLNKGQKDIAFFYACFFVKKNWFIIFQLKYGIIEQKNYSNAYLTHTKQNHTVLNCTQISYIKFEIKLDQAALIFSSLEILWFKKSATNESKCVQFLDASLINSCTLPGYKFN